MSTMIDPRDRKFWSMQMQQHLLFICEAAVNTSMRRDASRLHDAWKRHPQDRPIIDLLGETASFKQYIWKKTESGSWFGWLAPDFYHHVLEEALYFRRLLLDPPSPSEELRVWSDILADHAVALGSMVDPSKRKVILEGFALSDHVRPLSKEKRPSVRSVDMASREVERFLDKTANVPSTIPPLLRDHAIAEGEHFRTVVSPRILSEIR